MKTIILSDGTTGKIDGDVMLGDVVTLIIYPDGNGDAKEVTGNVVEILES